MPTSSHLCVSFPWLINTTGTALTHQLWSVIIRGRRDPIPCSSWILTRTCSSASAKCYPLRTSFNYGLSAKASKACWTIQHRGAIYGVQSIYMPLMLAST